MKFGESSCQTNLLYDHSSFSIQKGKENNKWMSGCYFWKGKCKVHNTARKPKPKTTHTSLNLVHKKFMIYIFGTTCNIHIHILRIILTGGYI